MSTVEKTPNYNLTKYVGIKYPLFLGDYSDDMEVIDTLIKGINDDIEDINRVIDTVSTQNIDDLLARIMALEVKVDNNANIIQSLLSSLQGLTSEVEKNRNKITTLTRTLETALGDITALKQRCDNMLTVLNTHGAAITQNSNAITNVNNEISRIKQDVIGNAQDIQTLATQLSSVLDSKQDKLTAGVGITIRDNVISATGGGGGGGVVADYSDGNLTLG